MTEPAPLPGAAREPVGPKPGPKPGPKLVRNRWTPAFLVLVCLALWLPGFFALPPVDRDEARFAQASRQMVDSGDYVTLHFQEETRLKKPVGIYWLQAASLRLFAPEAPDRAEIWLYRLPSLLGALLAVLATAWAGTRLFGPTIGTLAALMLAGCVLVGVEARMAKTDAVLLATVVLAQGALARLWLTRAMPGGPGWSLPLLFWLALGVGILIKGPITPLVSALTILALGLSESRFGWLRRLRPGMGLVVMAAVAAPWLVAIQLATHGRFFTESLGHDLLAKVAAGQEAKGLPPGYYLATFWISFAPFAVPVILALPWVWRHRRDESVRFCLAWLIPTWLVFEAVPTKLLHYTLPTFPALALLTAAAAADHFGRAAPQRRRPWLFGIAALLGSVTTLALVALIFVLPWIAEHGPWIIDHRIVDYQTAFSTPPPLVPTLGALILMALLAASLALWWRRRETGAVACALLWSGMFSLMAFQITLPQSDGFWLSRSAARAVARASPCPTTVVAAAGYSEPSLVFLLGTATRLGGAEGAAAHLRSDPACGLALVEHRFDDAFHTALAGQPVRPLETFSGFNYSRGKWQTLTLYTPKPEIPTPATLAPITLAPITLAPGVMAP